MLAGTEAGIRSTLAEIDPEIKPHRRKGPRAERKSAAKKTTMAAEKVKMSSRESKRGAHDPDAYQAEEANAEAFKKQEITKMAMRSPTILQDSDTIVVTSNVSEYVNVASEYGTVPLMIDNRKVNAITKFMSGDIDKRRPYMKTIS
jgi:hypothetical protein